MELKPKVIRITTVASTMNIILNGQLKYLNDFYDVKGITSRDDRHFTEISKREGINLYPVTMMRNISIHRDIKALYQIVKILLKEKPLVVHTQTPKAGLLGMFASRITGVPIRIHSAVGVPMYLKSKGMKRILLKFTERLTYYFALHVYPNSYGLQKLIVEEHLCNINKLRMIGNGSSNGINTSFFSAGRYGDNFRAEFRKELSIGSDSLVFCFIGRIVRDKGIHELVDAFLQLLRIDSIKKEAILLIVGPYDTKDDPISDSVFNIISHNNSIRYVGAQRDVTPYLFISDIFVFPSYREGLPNVLLQACSMGLPSIVTDIIGSNEIIIDGVNGEIIPPKDTFALYNSMQKLYFNPDRVFNYKSSTRNRIAEKYEQNQYWLNLKNEYDFLLSKI